MKKLMIVFLAVCTAVLMFCSAAYARDISIYVDGVKLACEQAPYISNGRTMVPMRKIFESLNATVEWNGNNRSITATKGSTTIVLQIDNPQIIKNGAYEMLDAVPVIVNNSTFVPLRAVSQALGTTVEWVDSLSIVSIMSPGSGKVLMYSLAGDVIGINASEMGAYQSVGWYTEPVIMMYAADGRTTVAPRSKISEYQSVGWHMEPYAAPSVPSGTSTQIYDTNQAVSVGNTVYETPTGSRYHLDPDCGGANSSATTLDKAISRGLTPCKKCAM